MRIQDLTHSFKPCPFCGSEDTELSIERSEYDNDGYLFEISCEDCRTDVRYTADDVTEGMTRLLRVWLKDNEVDDYGYTGGDD